MDLSHDWSGDLSVSPTGDLAVSDVPAVTQQRVLRRLLTNSGDYIWQPAYGAGLAKFVGAPTSSLQISAVVRGQIFQEQAVAPTPEPSIAVTNGKNGSVAVSLVYTDAPTAQTQVLNFSVSA
jgi:phage baseplate assembly protein W